GEKKTQENDAMDWCIRARKLALKSIEARGLTAKVKSMVADKKMKKKKKKKKMKKHSDFDELTSIDDLEVFSAEEEESDSESSDGDKAIRGLRNTVSTFADGVFDERSKRSKEVFLQRLSQFSSGPSDRKKEFNLNNSIVEAQTADQVLEAVSETVVAVAKGLSPSPLSPLNIATALHRIAKNMEKVSMMREHRLSFSRKREMSMLVSMAMVALPDCSPQGVSNIAWALSKIGGELLYLSEMERVAEVSLAKVSEFNPQNVANLAGAFASMQHSAPHLFSELSIRASNIIRSFQPQEIAQVLWAFASLYQPAEALFESLDGLLDDPDDGDVETLFAFSRDQMGNICWSYAVLGQLDRPFFAHIWKKLHRIEEQIPDPRRADVMFASQIHHVNVCLKLEYPHLLRLRMPERLENGVASARKTRKFSRKVTSSFQKEVLRLLVSTGLDWAKEYDMEEEGYTLDAALVDRKVALEIDGPTHFSRNSGAPLGHTMVKRRCIGAAGWKLVCVEHRKWEEVEGEAQQMQYLRDLL
ncbi:hypothetical protein M569_03053, partial [Genlisea aurea]